MYRAPHTAFSLILFKLDPPPSDHSNSFNRSDPPPFDHNKTDKKHLSEFLTCGICRHMNIKDFLPEQGSFYEYTWNIIACMLIIGKRRLALNIWPETPNQNTGTKEIILKI